MRQIIIGTAGHVDHGKSRLIQALTGEDPDRLAEEKRRGITIELGFASLPLPDGGTAGIVDVPGHEKFIGNMLAGAGGMDLALLVVAADEGVMPQTREHLDILRLLGVRRGLTVLTKADLVDAEWLELVTEEVRAALAGSFLADAPILPVSSVTGAGLPELRAALYQLAEAAEERDRHGPFRMAIDRVFTVEGFGSVVTGTALSGLVREGEELAVYPAGRAVRVRGLQVHGAAVDQASAGQRVAVNLAGIKREELRRGDFLAHPGSMAVTGQADVWLTVLPDAGHAVKSGSRLHFHHGAGERLCKAVLLDRDQLQPGEEGPAQLWFDQPAALCDGDRFVVRFYSPLETVGGGRVLDAAPARHRRHDPTVLERLRTLREGSPLERLAQRLYEQSAALPPVGGLAGLDGAQSLLERLEAQGTVIRLGPGYVHSRALQQWEREAETLLADYHRRAPLSPGLRWEELRGRFLTSWDGDLTRELLDRFAADGVLRWEGDRVALPGFQVAYTPLQLRLLEQLRTRYQEAECAPPTVEEVLSAYAGRERETARTLLDLLQEQGELALLSPGLLMDHAAYDRAWALFAEMASTGEPVLLGAFRDRLGVSRKYAVALMEQWDRKGRSKKAGEGRLPLPAASRSLKGQGI